MESHLLRPEWRKFAERHGQESLRISIHLPFCSTLGGVRQSRLGYWDGRTTMLYTHVASEDGRKIAARFGELLRCSPTAAIMPAENA
jgi:hypothetical protein